MKKLVSTLNMPYEEWLKYRKQGLGGSDAGAICGLNPYSSAMDVYYDKTTPDAAVEDNESMRQGRDLEEYVARRFMEETGLKVRRSNAIYQHEEIPYLLANVDRLIIGQNAGLECKTASAYSADKWKDGGIPSHYYVQCLHYLAVTGAETWYLAVVILGREFKYVRIERDEKAIADLLSIETRFWNENVLPRKMPDPDGSKICDEVISRYFPAAKKGNAIPLIGFDEKLKQRNEIEALIKKLETEIKRALPTVLTPERFTRMALSAINNTPKLAECTPRSFIAGLLNAAQLGLEPNTPLAQSYLIPHKNKGTLECQFQIGYRGMIDLAYRNDRVQSIEAHTVYANDEFQYELGLNPKLIHKPSWEEPGEIRAFYAIFKLDNGGYRFEVVNKNAMDAYAAKYSKAYDSSFSPLKSNYESMEKKTVLKQLLKYAPMKSDFQKAVSMDETIKTELSVAMSEVRNEEIVDAEFTVPAT